MPNQTTSSSLPTLAQQCADHMWKDDSAAQHIGAQLLEVGSGYCRMSMQVLPFMLNGHGSCHGGFMFTLADTCFAYACNSDNQPTVASGCSIDYLRPANAGELLIAEGKRVNRGRSTGLYDVQVTNPAGKTVAEFRGRAHQVGAHLIDPASLKETP